MKTFYEMMRILEDDQEQQGPELGLGNEKGQEGAEQAPEQPEEQPQEQPQQGGDKKHYMFFSNLKAIKGMVEEMLSMDASKVDSMLADGHDWASDHISTSRDDVEEVYNWLAGEMGSSESPQA